MTTINNRAQALGSIDLLALEQFATSIAALANQEAHPVEILDSVLQTIAENMNASCDGIYHDKQQILSEKAEQIGYSNYYSFQQDLLYLIGRRMADLRHSRLTAAQRAQRRLIQAL